MAPEERWLWGWGLGYVAIGSASVLVPVYALTLGAGPVLVGVLASTAAFAGVPGALLWGRLAERSGRRRPFVLFALVAVAVVLGVMSQVSRPMALLALNTVLWFVVAAAAPVCNLLMVEDADASQWDDRLGMLNAVQGYGWVGGLLVGVAWIGLTTPVSPARAQRSLFLVLAVVAGLAAALVARYLHDRRTAARRVHAFEERFGRRGLRDLGAGRVIRLLPFGLGRTALELRRFDPRLLQREVGQPLGAFLGGTFLFATGSAIFWGPMPAYLDARGLSAVAIFGLFLAGNLGSAVSYGRVAVLEPRLGAWRLQLGGIGARIVLFPGTVLVAGGILPIIAGFLALVGVSWALVAVTAPLLVARFTSPADRPAALASYTALSSGGTAIGSILGGAIAQVSGYAVADSIAAGLVLVGLLVAWRGLARDRKTPTRVPPSKP